MYKKKTTTVSVVEHFKETSGTIWISLKAVIIEKTLKEE